MNSEYWAKAYDRSDCYVGAIMLSSSDIQLPLRAHLARIHGPSRAEPCLQWILGHKSGWQISTLEQDHCLPQKSGETLLPAGNPVTRERREISELPEIGFAFDR